MLIVDNYQLRIMDPVKLTLKYSSNIKTFADFNRTFNSIIQMDPHFTELLKDVL